MRILIISYHFPPFNNVGAVRVGKIAKYLVKFGHDVRVVTAKKQPFQPTLDLEIPLQNVIYTNWLNVRKPVEIVSGGRNRIVAMGDIPQGPLWRALVKNQLWFLYRTFIYFPDREIGWFPFALAASSRLVEEWKPNVIYASATPFTSLLVAYSLSRKYELPWVAELRDLWVDSHIYPYGTMRRKLEERIEGLVLRSASGLVTVSEPLAETLNVKYRKPIAVVLSGYDPKDYPPDPEIPFREGLISIVYTGMIHETGQDPSPLFEALRRLGPMADKVRVTFYGHHSNRVREMVMRNDVKHIVKVNYPVPYKEALRIQCEADILLLLLWNDPKERGIYAGKLFEYIGARRPILAIGHADNVAAELIRDRSAGVVLDDPVQIEEKLRQWIHQKQQMGMIRSLPQDILLGLSREEQAKILQEFLWTISI